MAASMFSSDWFRVANIKPRLRPHVRLHRHVIRGAPWFILQDGQTGRYHRISPAARQIVAQMDGRRNVGAIWRHALDWSTDTTAPPTQDEVIGLLAQLHGANLLLGDLPPDLGALSERADRTARRKLLSRWKNPLALRVPLLDPDPFLTWTLPLFRPLFSWVGLFLWLSLVSAGIACATLNWSELTQNVLQRARLGESLLLFLLVYPPLKLLHELGHGYAVKRWGESVHETGIMFLVLMPLPYVDASHSAAFGNKWQRIIVSSAGIMVELGLASAALLVWAAAEPGFLQDLAFATAVIGGVSTLVFNANPLLRFDGYHILADAIEIPNLGQRSNNYVSYLSKRYLFGLRSARSPVTARGEAPWFFGYAIAAYLYRVLLMLSIAWFLAGQFFFIGVALAIWAIVSGLVWPALKSVGWALGAPESRAQRWRGNAILSLGIVSIIAAFFWVPLPLNTRAMGVNEVPPTTLLRAGTKGTLEKLLVEPGQYVTKGTAVAYLSDPLLEARGKILEAQRDDLALRIQHMTGGDRFEIQMLTEQLRHSEEALSRNNERLDSLTVRAEQDGKIVFSQPEDLSGRYFARGDTIGHVLGNLNTAFLVAIPAHAADFVRNRLQGVSVVPATAVNRAYQSTVIRDVPKASTALPVAALGARGGGSISIDPRDASGRTAVEPVAIVYLSVPPSMLPLERLGTRVHVRFDHGNEPLGYRIMRSVRRAFLRQFDV